MKSLDYLGYKVIKLITSRTLTLLTLLFLVIVLGTLWNVSRVSEDLVKTQALENAILLAESMREARTVYSSEAVAKVSEHPAINVTHDYTRQDWSIPLPATLLQELSRRIRESNPEMSIRLYSDYPFPWNNDGGPQDQFERVALEKLKENPYEPYVSIEPYKGNIALRYAEADLMQASCVACHNSYPGSPKTDWKTGDIRGILEIAQPLETFQAKIRGGLKGILLMLSSLSLVGISGLTIAIRDLKQQSQQLSIAKEQLETVIDAVPGSIAWINSEGIYLGINRQLAQEWNINQEAIIGRNLGFLHQDNGFTHFLRNFINSRDNFTSGIIDLDFSNDSRSYLVAAQKYQNQKAIVFVGINITERKRAIEALRIMEEKYRSIYENALEGIFQSNLEGQYISVNPAMAKLYGYDSPADLINSVINITTQIYVDPQSRLAFINMLAIHGEVKNFEYRSFRKDGSIIWVEENTRLVRNDKGEILYFEGIVKDITERKRIETELKTELEELRIEINEQKRAQDVAQITRSDYFQNIQEEIESIDLDQFWSN
ncbi:MAG: PAS domain S-box protein [Gloeocapsa sp. DLM2.Bin57]|nr:MAG: PAS domain S-box protein [Gloeocapsa sp. DLM2.Bin57]